MFFRMSSSAEFIFELSLSERLWDVLIQNFMPISVQAQTP